MSSLLAGAEATALSSTDAKSSLPVANKAGADFILLSAEVTCSSNPPSSMSSCDVPFSCFSLLC